MNFGKKSVYKERTGLGMQIHTEIQYYLSLIKDIDLLWFFVT
jgi:hypothetical protein